jgi:hypothetical protein
LEINCTSVTAGTNTACALPLAVIPARITVLLWKTFKPAPDVTMHAATAMDNKPKLFMETSSQEFKIAARAEAF